MSVDVLLPALIDAAKFSGAVVAEESIKIAYRNFITYFKKQYSEIHDKVALDSDVEQNIKNIRDDLIASKADQDKRLLQLAEMVDRELNTIPRDQLIQTGVNVDRLEAALDIIVQTDGPITGKHFKSGGRIELTSKRDEKKN